MPPPSAVVPSVGIQALVLCGPGVSLNTFTTNEEYPKALIPLANRPLIYYQLSWLKKSGITGRGISEHSTRMLEANKRCPQISPLSRLPRQPPLFKLRCNKILILLPCHLRPRLSWRQRVLT